MIKIDDYWIIVDDTAQSEIKYDEWCLEIHEEYKCDLTRIPDENTNYSWFLRKLNMDYLKEKPKEFSFWRKVDGSCKKILASQNPEHNLPSITFSDEVAKEMGIVDIKKLADDWACKNGIKNAGVLVAHWSEWREVENIWKNGYNQALSDNKDKLFTEKQVKEAILKAWDDSEDTKNIYNIIQSLTKKEYGCELEVYEPIKNSPSEVDRFIKITNNSVKVIKLMK